MRFTTSQIAAVLGVAVVGPDVEIDGASIDTRTLRPGQLFVPVVAERDGHDFVAAAITAGAPAFLWSRTAPPPPGATALLVADTLPALRSLATRARDRIDGPVVGITGSVGKTTVKDLARSVLAADRPTHASERSFNNDLGVPLTVLGAPDDVGALVVEMGARGIGHIASLAAWVRPTIGVVTRVALAHSAFFGSLDAIARGKGEMVEALPAEGTAVLNAGDERVAAMAGRTRARVLAYGVGQGDVRAVDLRVDDELRLRFRLESPWGHVEVSPAVRGPHHAENAVAAAAIGLAAGVDLGAVAAGLAAATVSPSRMEVGRTPSGAVVINDAYNANPASMRAALDALTRIPATRRLAVLGTMAELGPWAAEEHRLVGELLAARGIEAVSVAEPAFGLPVVPDGDAALVALGPLGPGDAILVKGSRVAGLDRVAARLLAPDGGGPPSAPVGGVPSDG